MLSARRVRRWFRRVDCRSRIAAGISESADGESVRESHQRCERWNDDVDVDVEQRGVVYRVRRLERQSSCQRKRPECRHRVHDDLHVELRWPWRRRGRERDGERKRIVISIGPTDRVTAWRCTGCFDHVELDLGKRHELYRIRRLDRL